MKFLYMIIVAGFGFIYYLSQQEKGQQVKTTDKQGMEASYGQEAPPTLEEKRNCEDEIFIKKFIPNYN